MTYNVFSGTLNAIQSTQSADVQEWTTLFAFQVWGSLFSNSIKCHRFELSRQARFKFVRDLVCHWIAVTDWWTSKVYWIHLAGMFGRARRNWRRASSARIIVRYA